LNGGLAKQNNFYKMTTQERDLFCEYQGLCCKGKISDGRPVLITTSPGYFPMYECMYSNNCSLIVELNQNKDMSDKLEERLANSRLTPKFLQ